MPQTGTSTECQLLRPRRPRVLLSAYACYPNWGSEPGIGWWRATEIAKYCDTWVLTHGNETQQCIDDYAKAQSRIPSLRFVFVRPTRLEAAIEGLPVLNYVAYRVWLRRSFRIARQLHAKVNFDIAHQVTYAGYREPSYLYRLGIPFVWGPIGGVQNYPWRFMPGAGVGGALAESSRSIANTLQLYASPRVRAAARAAAAVFSANLDGERKFRQVLGVRSTLLCDVGAVQVAHPSRRPISQNGPLNILWAGRLITRKSLELVIEALALLPRDVAYTLTVLGDGPRRRAWQRLAQRKGVSAHIEWCGRLPQEEALEKFRSCDVFVFSSLRDTTGTVMLEALAAGKPVICLDHQGAASIITNECGIKIPVTNRTEVEQRLCEAIVTLYRDRQRCETLAQGALRRSEDYAWSVQALQIVQEYNRILESTGSDARCDVNGTMTSAAGPLQPDSLNAAPVRVGSLAS